MSTSKKEVAAVVIDNGTGNIKAGFAGDDNPTVELNSYVACPKADDIRQNLIRNETYVRDIPLNELDKFKIYHTSRSGIIANWADMKKIWHHIFDNELKVKPEEHPILMTETFYNPKVNRENMTQVLFETFRTPAMFIGIQDVLSMYARGLITGISCNYGDGVSSVMPIYDGYVFQSGCTRLTFGGRELTNNLAKLLGMRGYYFTTAVEMEYIRDMKEKYCYVAHDFEQEFSKTADSLAQTYTLPDGQGVVIGKERFRCSEGLFQPSLLGLESTGIHKTIFDSINECEIDARQSLFKNIVLAGGTTLLPGFENRLAREISNLAPHANIKMDASKERKYSTWVGGSILASLSTFQQMWISKQDYEEYGTRIVHKRCF